MSVRGVQAVLARLIQKGLVEILVKGNQYSPTQFALHLDKGQRKLEFISSARGGDRNDPTKYAKGAAARREAAFRAGTIGNAQNSTCTSTQVNRHFIPVNAQIDESEAARNSHEPSESHQTTISYPSVSSLTDEDVEAIMRTIGETPAQLEAATPCSSTEMIPGEVPLRAGSDSPLNGAILETEAVPMEEKLGQTRFPARAECFEPLIQQQMKTFRNYYSSTELKTKLGSGSPIAREAARRVLAECRQPRIQTVAV